MAFAAMRTARFNHRRRTGKVRPLRRLAVTTASATVIGLMSGSNAWADGKVNGGSHAVAALGGGGPVICSHAGSDPAALYGDEIRFRVLRNGTPVGHHRVRFRSDDGTVIAETEFDVRVKLVIFTAYRFEHVARDVWRNGCLVSLSARTNDNGTETSLEARLRGGNLAVRQAGDVRTIEAGIFPTTHWNVGVVQAERVLNTITGRVNEIEIVPLGREQIRAGGRTVTAQRYRYTGELRADVWYDTEGRWVKMRFSAQDGSIIEYACERCGLAAPA